MFPRTALNNLKLYVNMDPDEYNRDFLWIKRLGLKLGEELIVAKSRKSNSSGSSIIGIEELYIPRLNIILSYVDINADLPPFAETRWCILTEMHIKGNPNCVSRDKLFSTDFDRCNA